MNAVVATMSSTASAMSMAINASSSSQ
jgi:hypothetical protein